MFLPPHPWEDLEGIPSHGTGIKLEGMERAALNAVAGKLKIKSPASQPLKELEDGVLRAHARKQQALFAVSTPAACPSKKTPRPKREGKNKLQNAS